MELIKLRRLTNKSQTQTITAVAVRLFAEKTEDEVIAKIRRVYDEDISEVKFFFIGDLTKYPASEFSNFVKKIKEGNKDSRPAYRNYAVSLEQQKKSLRFVNVCEDAQTSWNTVRTSLGARNIRVECYGAVAQIIYNKD